MPNKDLIKKDYIVNDERVKNYLGNKISGTNLTTIKSRLEKKEKLTDDEKLALDWVTKKYEQERKSIDGYKRTKMRNGDDSTPNAFKKTHTKDKNNNNPTKVGGLAKLNTTGDNKHVSGGKVSDQIENNRVQYYESIYSEIQNINYLIEYMNNNKNKL